MNARKLDSADVVVDRQRFPFFFAAEDDGHPPDRYLDGVLIKRGDRGDRVEARRNILKRSVFFAWPALDAKTLIVASLARPSQSVSLISKSKPERPAIL